MIKSEQNMKFIYYNTEKLLFQNLREYVKVIEDRCGYRVYLSVCLINDFPQTFYEFNTCF